MNKSMTTGRRVPLKRATRAVAMLAIVLGTVVHVPQTLAFPHRQRVGDTLIYSVAPITARASEVIARSDRQVRASALFGPGYGKRLFLTDGGWRWRLLALQSASADAFGVTRPLSGAIVMNRSDIGHDRIANGRTIGGVRRLSDVLTHERTHGLIRARFGLLADRRYPGWLVEGYCDYVTGGGSLSEADVARLQRSHQPHPALIYYEGRKRVERELLMDGSVERLFARHARF